MCAVNDAKRSEYNAQIANLNAELKNENQKKNAIIIARGEIQSAINLSQCAIDNISECDFGGDKILSSIKTSQQGYKDKEDYYDKYLIDCEKAINQILSEISQLTILRDSLPKDCGVCSECNPPKNNLTMGIATLR